MTKALASKYPYWLEALHWYTALFRVVTLRKTTVSPDTSTFGCSVEAEDMRQNGPVRKLLTASICFSCGLQTLTVCRLAVDEPGDGGAGRAIRAAHQASIFLRGQNQISRLLQPQRSRCQMQVCQSRPRRCRKTHVLLAESVSPLTWTVIVCWM